MIESSTFTSIDVGNILTAGTVLVAAGGLAYTWRHDQQLRRREAANRIRSAAAATIAGLDLWVDLALSLFDNLQEVFVKISQELLANQDVDNTRDRLWAELNRVHSETVTAQRQEKLQSAYSDLYGYGRDSYARFSDTLSRLKSQETRTFGSFLVATQADVRGWQDRLADYEPAELGNSLRDTAAHYAKEMKQSLELLMVPMRTFLEGLVVASDKKLIPYKEQSARHLESIEPGPKLSS